MYIPYDMTDSDDLDFINATKADPDPTMLYSASANSFSCQHCFTFQLLEPSRVISQHTNNGAIINYFPMDAIQFE
jgi:hypothetical protein